MATVDLKEVRKVYAGGVEAVKGVSIAVPDRQLCVLVGPSGCGKSTLLRMIAGLESITDGTVSIDGKVVNAIGPTERDIAMVFQNYALYPHMKVYDNMAYGLRNRGTPKDEIDRRVRETAKTLELYDRPANQFVAGFIGSPAMNFLPGTLRRSGPSAFVELKDGTRLQAPARAAGTDGQPIVFGTRPEHLALADSGGIPAKVVVMEPTGMDTFVACRHEGEDLSAVFRERHDFPPGSSIHLVPDPQRAHLFDAGTGQRLAA